VSGPPFRVVVVGIDGSRESDAALRFAADEAALRGALLRIVCASEPSASGCPREAFAPTPDEFVHAEHHPEEVLRGALKQLKGEPLEVEAVAEEGGPALEQRSG
jgi:nucleotide-binding universal stress UspA family protein